MSQEPQEKVNVDERDSAQKLNIFSFEPPPPTKYDSDDKEFHGPAELDGPAVPRERHFSETSTVIAPQVISTNITLPNDTSIYSTAKSVEVAELAAEPTRRDTGLRPRGIGTLWSRTSRKVRLISLGILVIIIILVIVGTLLGVFLGRRDNKNTTHVENQFDILDVTKLAAISFQNVDNATDKSVFFQLTSSLAIMRARRNDSMNGAWVFENVSQAMIEGGSSIFPKAGTPLVVTAPDAVDPENLPNFWLDLYFMSVHNIPFQIWSWSTPQTDPTKDLLWHPEGLQNYQVIFSTGFAKGTQLAAYRDQCVTNCSNSSRLLYQGANSDLMLGVSSIADWMSWKVTDLSGDGAGMPELPQLEMNSSIAMARYSPVSGAEPSGMKMYYDVSHELEEYFLVNGSWSNGSFRAPLGDQSEPPEVSVVTYATDSGDTNLEKTLVAILFDNGTVIVHWQEVLNGPWQMGSASPSNVSAMAISNDLTAYCVVLGRVQEWQISGSLPTNWTLVSNVTTV